MCGMQLDPHSYFCRPSARLSAVQVLKCGSDGLKGVDKADLVSDLNRMYKMRHPNLVDFVGACTKTHDEIVRQIHGGDVLLAFQSCASLTLWPLTAFAASLPQMILTELMPMSLHDLLFTTDSSTNGSKTKVRSSGRMR